MSQYGRLAPLTGVVYAVLTLVAFATASGAPSNSASGSKVIAFYEAHRSNARASDLMWMLAFAFLLLLRGNAPLAPAPHLVGGCSQRPGGRRLGGVCSGSNRLFQLRFRSHGRPATSRSCGGTNTERSRAEHGSRPVSWRLRLRSRYRPCDRAQRRTSQVARLGCDRDRSDRADTRVHRVTPALRALGCGLRRADVAAHAIGRRVGRATPPAKSVAGAE